MSRMLVSFAAFLFASGACAADEYYLTVFSCETVPFRGTKTHTFATVTRIPTAGVVETNCISWMPATLKVRPFTLLPEQGVNLTLAQTLDFCRQENLRVSVWGPYAIEPELFCLLRDQSNWLSSGNVKYKSTDNVVPSFIAMNCYHAIWQVVAPLKKYAGPYTCGDHAGGNTVRIFSDWIISTQANDDMLKLVGVDQYPLVRRDASYRPSRFDAMRSALGR
jgi:hypothetical protein